MVDDQTSEQMSEQMKDQMSDRVKDLIDKQADSQINDDQLAQPLLLYLQSTLRWVYVFPVVFSGHICLSSVIFICIFPPTCLHVTSCLSGKRSLL